MEHASAALDWVQRKHPIHVAGWDGLRPYVGDPPGTWFVEGSLAMPLALARMGRRAEAEELVDMLKAPVEDGLGDDRCAGGLGHEDHELGLHIGREARIRRGRHVLRPDLGAAHHVERLAVDVDRRA